MMKTMHPHGDVSCEKWYRPASKHCALYTNCVCLISDGVPLCAIWADPQRTILTHGFTSCAVIKMVVS